MAATRTSSRQAARKANEAISSTNGSRGKTSGAQKRKGSTAKLPAPKKEKKEDTEPKEQNGEDHIAAEHQEKEQRDKTEEIQKAHEAGQPQPEHKLKHEPSEEDQKEEKEDKAKTVNGHEEKATTPQEKPPDKEPEAGVSVESGIRKSEEREDIVPSNILEKGIIYFFFRPRVNVEEPHSIQDVSRSFIVLRPTPKGAMLGADQGSVATDAHCRLMMLPKKKFPTSARERDMGFVEKAGISMKDLQDSFITGAHYETSTRGERTRPDAKPYAEGVYAITAARRSSHLVYILTIPSEAGDLQHDFGVYQRGSWIIQSKNPKYPGPSYARLPKDPEYPDE
ncbi:hypothetical protein MPDQ_007972 [Monascus purpureus]|uniref:Uncharacterized protein n=1 Tax=Monascus purpureus TaxID=5098 RepID=A0A507QUE3_MONPU|nr:hypothetical protein MPDQ_007972 [Monascus purpureus]